jgi:hypothetical protein
MLSTVQSGEAPGRIKFLSHFKGCRVEGRARAVFVRRELVEVAKVNHLMGRHR